MNTHSKDPFCQEKKYSLIPLYAHIRFKEYIMVIFLDKINASVYHL